MTLNMAATSGGKGNAFLLSYILVSYRLLPLTQFNFLGSQSLKLLIILFLSQKQLMLFFIIFIVSFLCTSDSFQKSLIFELILLLSDL